MSQHKPGTQPEPNALLGRHEFETLEGCRVCLYVFGRGSYILALQLDRLRVDLHLTQEDVTNLALVAREAAQTGRAGLDA